MKHSQMLEPILVRVFCIKEEKVSLYELVKKMLRVKYLMYKSIKLRENKDYKMR